MLEYFSQSEGIWQYVILFILAAAPWLEVFLVVPLGIAAGLNPVAVSFVGFFGNWIPVLLIGFFFVQISAWLKRRRERKARKAGRDPDADTQQVSKKDRRARKIWERYGIPGLALLAPAIVGTDIAALLALSFGSSKRWVMIWITISLALWTIGLAIASIYGFDYLGFFET